MIKLTAVGCYIFAGGFTLGVSKHFKVLAHLEDGIFGVDTFKLNFPRVPVYTDPDGWPLRQLRREKLELVYSNPPCAPWSATGRSAKHGGAESWKSDPRVECVHRSFSLLKELRPHAWIWESVTRAYTTGRQLVDYLTTEAHHLGYSVTHFLTDAQLHGLPQRRQRFMFVAHNVELDFKTPQTKIITVERALRGIKARWYPSVSKQTQRIIKRTKPGYGMRESFDELNPRPKLNKKGQVIGRPVWMNYRLMGDRPAGTLIGGCHALHPTEHRFISAEEHAALCGYPKDYRWFGPPSNWYPQIARAVTPVMGEYLARTVAAGIRRGVKTQRQLTTVDFRKLVRNFENAR